MHLFLQKVVEVAPCFPSLSPLSAGRTALKGTSISFEAVGEPGTTGPGQLVAMCVGLVSSPVPKPALLT